MKLRITVSSQSRIFWTLFQMQGLHSKQVQRTLHIFSIITLYTLHTSLFRSKHLLLVHHSASNKQIQDMIHWRQHTSLQPPDITLTESIKRVTFHIVIVYVTYSYVIHFYHSLLFKFSSKPLTDYTPTKPTNRWQNIYCITYITSWYVSSSSPS